MVRIVGILLLFLSLPYVVFAAEQKNSDVATPLLGITGIADADTEVVEENAAEGGAMGMEKYFSTQLQVNLKACGQSVSKVIHAWVKDNNLVPVEEKIKPDTLLVRAWSTDQKGIFEAKYKTNEKPPFIRASLDYYATNGKALPIEIIGSFLKKYKISNLYKSLSEAIQCD
jgi:hypothetical protein